MDRRVFKSVGLLLMCLSVHFFSFGQTKDCRVLDNLQVESVVQKDNGGDATVVLKFDDSSLEKYAIWMLTPQNEQKIIKDGTKTFKDLEPGDYEFIIVDRKGCTKKVDVKVK